MPPRRTVDGMVEWAQWTRVEVAGGDRLDLMHVRLRSRFVRHAHAEYAIGVCLAGPAGSACGCQQLCARHATC
jgi:hypothetical protein